MGTCPGVARNSIHGTVPPDRTVAGTERCAAAWLAEALGSEARVHKEEEATEAQGG